MRLVREAAGLFSNIGEQKSDQFIQRSLRLFCPFLLQVFNEGPEFFHFSDLRDRLNFEIASFFNSILNENELKRVTIQLYFAI